MDLFLKAVDGTAHLWNLSQKNYPGKTRAVYEMRQTDVRSGLM